MIRENAGDEGGSTKASNAATKIELDAADYMNATNASAESQASQAFHKDVVDLAKEDPATFAQIKEQIANYDTGAAQLHLPTISIGSEIFGSKAGGPQVVPDTLQVTATSTTDKPGLFGQIFLSESPKSISDTEKSKNMGDK